VEGKGVEAKQGTGQERRGWKLVGCERKKHQKVGYTALHVHW
jgi:hypothetical protein